MNKIEKLRLDYDTQAQVENLTYKLNEIIDNLNRKIERCVCGGSRSKIYPSDCDKCQALSVPSKR